MVIDVYSGFQKKPNSTKQPSSPRASLTVRLKEPCSVLNPVFLLAGYNLSDNYVKWGNRYYYINDIVIIGNELAEYHCSTDVLATYKINIGASTQYVTRSAVAYDEDIVDSAYISKSSPTHTLVDLPNIHNAFNISNGEYIIGIKNADSANGVAYYGLRAPVFKKLAALMFSSSWLDATDITMNLQKLIVDPMQYIASVYWYPFDVTPTGVQAQGVKFGFWDATTWDASILGYLLDDSTRIKSVTDPITLPDHPQISRGKYLNGSPYTQMILDVFGFGRVPVEPNMFVRSRSASVQVSVDLFTGVGELVMESTNGRVIKETAMVGVPIQLSQVTEDLIRSSIVTMKAGGDLIHGHLLGSVSGIYDAISMAMPQVRTTGSSGSVIAYNKTPQINMIFYNITDEDNAQLGRPLCTPRTINTLSGYIQCERSDLDISASPSEKEQIVSYMDGGFYYE